MSRPKNQTDGDGRLVEAFRNERLEHLRRSISEGDYQVDNRNVAAAIVRRGLKGAVPKSRHQG